LQRPRVKKFAIQLIELSSSFRRKGFLFGLAVVAFQGPKELKGPLLGVLPEGAHALRAVLTMNRLS
jgi:hypothetical protein